MFLQVRERCSMRKSEMWLELTDRWRGFSGRGGGWTAASAFTGSFGWAAVLPGRSSANISSNPSQPVEASPIASFRALGIRTPHAFQSMSLS
ncbi:hypothetical protein L596_005153 [Steinernema carpocapsae]|uniref:Uncharacterized protein n=1 Tax=Steinernema carpocapsae TaxID=34508 RepID=A0A4U8UZ58_STECR|nr:hypothetical protein L596_005153 [Steinernema carpocapsae]